MVISWKIKVQMEDKVIHLFPQHDVIKSVASERPSLHSVLRIENNPTFTRRDVRNGQC